MKIFNNVLKFNVQNKLLVSFLLFSTVPLFILGSYASINLRDTIYNEKKDSLTRAIDIAYSIVQNYYNQYKNGIYNESFAQNQSLVTLKVLRYGPIDKDYFWVHEEVNSKPVMVMHPFTPQLIGQDLSNYKDPNGVYIFNEMYNFFNAHVSGFVQY